ncbi:MAG TPA: glycosyltransferase family 9 protein [Usitatibacter sp.]|jgi:lipopolysaccharide heptosyltransferase II|nr:glycosyltransferase family 9 protein [Usitatibacter sp.]
MSRGWDGVRRILCVRLDNMGDVLMTTPAMRALRQSFAGASITLLGSRSGARCAEHIPEVDETIAYAAPWMKLPLPTAPADDLDMIALLANRRFDAAVIFTAYSQNPLPAALMCHLAGIPRRLAHCRENPYHLLGDWVVETEPGAGIRHEVRRQLDLVATVGAFTDDERLSFRVTAEDRLRAAMKAAEAGLDPSRPCLVVHPGATAPSRRYSPERFGAAALEMSRRFDCSVAVTGDASERALAEDVARGAGARARSLAGQLSLGEFAGLMSLSPVLVSSNTGAVHIAAAVGTPVVDLYALTNPQHTPWQVPHRVLSNDVPCRNCYKSVCPHGHMRCLDVPVEEVVAAAAALWNDHEPRILRAAA